MEYAISNNKRIRPSDVRWLALAVLAHALLLLVPLRDHAPRTIGSPAQIVLRLVAQERRETEALPAPAEDAASPLAPAEVAAAPSDRVEPVEPLAGDPGSVEIERAFAEPKPEVTVARLMGLRGSVAERVPTDKPERPQVLNLGKPAPFERPHNWQPGTGAEALAPFDNAFNGKTVPAEVEIVDRWLAADGSHNVVVETPAGLRMCGRARPWNAMQPLLEHIMMWTICGGDGKSSFKFRPREPLDRDFIDPVAKDATEP